MLEYHFEVNATNALGSTVTENVSVSINNIGNYRHHLFKVLSVAVLPYKDLHPGIFVWIFKNINAVFTLLLPIKTASTGCGRKK